jgi:hypothetical protein
MALVDSEASAAAFAAAPSATNAVERQSGTATGSPPIREPMQNSQLRKTAARTADALEAEIATALRTHMKMTTVLRWGLRRQAVA